MLLFRWILIVVLVGISIKPAGGEIFLPVLTSEPVYNMQAVGNQIFLMGRSHLYVWDLDDDKGPVPIASKAVNEIAVYNDQIYLGTDSGLFMFRDESSFSLGESVLGKFRVLSLEVWDGELWIGTNKGLKLLGLESMILSGGVTNLKTIGNRLWLLGSQGVGFFEVGDESRTFRRIEADSSEIEINGFSSIEEAGNEVWLTTIRDPKLGRFGPAYRIDGDKIRPDERLAEHPEVIFIGEAAGCPWFGTPNGAVYLESEKPVVVESPHPVNVVYDAAEGVWLGTTQGLMHLPLLGAGTRMFPVHINAQAMLQFKDWFLVASGEGLFSYVEDLKVAGDLNTNGRFLLGRHLYAVGAGYSDGRSSERSWEWCIATTRAGASKGERCIPVGKENSVRLDWAPSTVFVQFRDDLGNRSEVQEHNIIVLPTLVALFSIGVILLLLTVALIMARLLKRRRAETERAQKEAMIDKLTGLPRKGQGKADQLLEDRFETVADKKWTLMLIDVDRFKEINKEDGYLAADEALTKLGELLRTSCRTDAGDFAMRWGGDEFVILMLGVEGAKAEQLVERIHSRIRNEDFKFLKTQLTVSIGVCDSRSALTKLKAAFKAAEKNVHEAKQQPGKNQVVWT